MGVAYVVALLGGLVVANVAVAARSGRTPTALFVEIIVYAAWAALAIFIGLRTATYPHALAILVIALAAALVSRLGLGKRVLRFLGLEGAWSTSKLGRRLGARMSSAMSRMAERERKAQELGISVVEVLELEHREKQQKR